MVDAAIAESVAANVIAELPGVPGRCTFTHSLIRQTLYEGLTSTRRARLHLRVAESLERMHEGRREPAAGRARPPLLPRAAARGAPKAIDYAERAARSARPGARLRGSGTAVPDGARRVERGGRSARETLALLLGLGDAQAKARDVEAAQAVFRDAAEVARRSDSVDCLAQAALGYGAAGQMMGGVVDEVAVALLEEALAALGETDDGLRIRVLARLAMELSFAEQRERASRAQGEAPAAGTGGR